MGNLGLGVSSDNKDRARISQFLDKADDAERVTGNRPEISTEYNSIALSENPSRLCPRSRRN